MDTNSEKTILTLEQNGCKVTWEGSWDANLNDILSGFVACLRGVSFGPWVIKGIKDWCEDQLDESDNNTK